MSKNVPIRTLLAGGALLAVSGAVNAATVDFGVYFDDLGYSAGDVVASSQTIDGIAMTLVPTNDLGTTEYVVWKGDKYGVGVMLDGELSGRRPIASTDSSGDVNETLGVVFGSSVDIGSVSLASLDFTSNPADLDNQSITVEWGTGALGSTVTGFSTFIQDGDDHPDGLDHNSYNDTWSIGAIDINWIRVVPGDQADGGGTEAYLKAFGDVQISVVPVPAAVWLMGSALGLLGFMRRK